MVYGDVLGYCKNSLNRKKFIEKAASEAFDVCIIGGGASGAGCALDAQARGLKTILIEKSDFGSATSSKSTKLVHGGVRYLEQAVKKLSLHQYKMVRKALKERTNILKIAPHLTRPLQLVTPCRTWVESMYYFLGLKMYDWISGSANIGKSELLNKQEALELIPNLKSSGLFNAVSYYDGQMDDQRLNLALIQTAVEKGAICINHCSAEAFEKDASKSITAVDVIDRLTGKAFVIKARKFINATGPFSDKIRLLANPRLSARIRVSKGVHIMLPGSMMDSKAALLIPKTRDGRLIFAIPYQHYLLVGTTEDETNLTERPFGPTENEISYLLEYINDYLEVQATAADIQAGFGGLRPLITAPGSTKNLVRDHEVEYDPASGLISILGGKWTTYRLMAKDTLDKAAQLLKPREAITDPFTENIVLAGGENFDQEKILSVLFQKGFDKDIATHLLEKYGSRALLIAEHFASEEEQTRLLPGYPFTLAELLYNIEFEMACTARDILDRRWGVQSYNWETTLQLLPIVGDIMLKKLQWNTAEELHYMGQYKKELLEMIQATGRKLPFEN
jgi:glycerol-3-phosphate dehydrogenase